MIDDVGINTNTLFVQQPFIPAGMELQPWNGGNAKAKTVLKQ